MATLSSAGLQHFIGRLFDRHRHIPITPKRTRSTAIRRLIDHDHPSPDTTDLAWLQRVELRDSRLIIDIFEHGGLRQRLGQSHILLVDSRCGLIRSHPIGWPPIFNPAACVGAILAEASNCHAAGIILGTNDLTGKILKSVHCRQLVSDLYRKGEATEIFLLDHFVLTAGGWSRTFPSSGKECI